MTEGLKEWADEHLTILFLLPSIVIISFICVFPLGYSLFMSFHIWELASPLPRRFAGVANYIRIVQEARFWYSLIHSVSIVGTSVAIQILVGFTLALLLNREFKGRSLVISLFLIPTVIAPVVVAFMWRMLYSEHFGPINYAIHLTLGFKGIPWLSRPLPALFSIVLANAWEWFPLVLLVSLGGLQSIPDDYYDAAKIDGASGWQIVRYIVLPLMGPILLVIALVRVIEDFKLFGIIHVLTHGGPGMSTETLNYYTYLKGFRFFSFGYAGALSYMQLIVVVAIAIILIRNIMRE
jgi:multiple sugar transport system permease protein